ncbi:MAG: Asp-tRNA(Asn)/Glu-tRNA(Gln) amidotransferase subunit GatA [Candidatus Dadabacteria bacterium]|nr:MAG: Asp-tRNA(Asn)/Glu-tRNA(Gln) amidotransferase subunit GatA [Candidatus Dadabacteria bacterium]
MREDIAFWEIEALRRGLLEGEFSSKELVALFLDRIERFKSLNAFVRLCDDAMKEAEKADVLLKDPVQRKRKPLLGIPVALKDVILTKGVTTTACSRILSNFLPPYSATVTTKLQEAGAIIIGKTNMDEFAMGSSNENSYFGAVKNPWDTERVPGGSSGGSAVCVSARLAPAALGSDTGGSIRQPASFCGVVGIKPTYGRVSRYGIVAFASSLDQVGTFAGTVKDAAEVMEVISGFDRNDSTSVEMEVPKYSASLTGDISGIRIGVPKEYFVGGIDAEVSDSIKKALTLFEKMGARIVDISLPHTEYALAVYYIIAPAEASSNLARYDGIRYGVRAEGANDLIDLYYKTRSEGFGPEVKRRIMLGTYVLSSGYYDAYYLKAQKVRALVAGDFKEAFDNQCDVIVCPVAPTTAFKLGDKVDDPVKMYLNDIFTIPVSLAGLPGLSLPCDFDSKGLPVGLQIVGNAFDEETVFKVAYAFECEAGLKGKHPKMVT